MKNQRIKFVVIGLLFAMLWASASTAGKFGLRSVEPLTFFSIRFALAGLILAVFAHLVMRYRLPAGKEWWQIAVFGTFNTTLYLGIFIIALQYVAAGITTMAIALNPLLISVMSSVVMKRRVLGKEWLGILLGMIGVALATYPLVSSGHSTIGGVLLIILCMVTYSAGSVYYSTVQWQLQRTTINAWQIVVGAIQLAPFAFYFHHQENSYDLRFWVSLAWLVLPVSIGAVQLWLRLLKEDTVRASMWLFLCPVFGLIFATLFLSEPFTVHTGSVQRTVSVG